MWTSLLILTTATPLFAVASYIPPYIQGHPLEGFVVSIEPPDIRGQDLYRIEHKVEVDDGTATSATVHRTYEEFRDLHKFLTEDIWLPTPPTNLPPLASATVASLDAYLQGLYSDRYILGSHTMQDFLGINWDGHDVTFMYNLSGFLKMLLIDRIPQFMPEPPIIGKDDFMVPETPFERYIYFKAFKGAKTDLDTYMALFTAYCESTPQWQGPEDGSDVVHPNASSLVLYPDFYNYTYVHFLPGGFLNGHTVRISYLGNSKFTFLNEEYLRQHLSEMYLNTVEPQTILDVGTGTGGSAFVLGQLFPEAQVMGVDMSPVYVRFCRAAAAKRNATNVAFHQANAQMLDFVPDNSVDFVNFAYVLHEMPANDSKAIVREMFRILRPGGILNGFDVPYKSNSYIRDYFVSTNTWDLDWHIQGSQGPEPYIGEYEYELKLPSYLLKVGFQDVQEVKYSYFESIFKAKKPA